MLVDQSQFFTYVKRAVGKESWEVHSSVLSRVTSLKSTSDINQIHTAAAAAAAIRGWAAQVTQIIKLPPRYNVDMTASICDTIDRVGFFFKHSSLL